MYPYIAVVMRSCVDMFALLTCHELRQAKACHTIFDIVILTDGLPVLYKLVKYIHCGL